MTSYAALLRAVNVGGTGALPMRDLRALCEAAGFERVQTYIASGNVVFASDRSEAEVKAALEQLLEGYAGACIPVMIRTAAELRALVDLNPFPHARPNQLLVTFLHDAPSVDALATVRHQAQEELSLGPREIWIHYGEGMARSKLVVPAAKAGTARNLNTVRKLAELAAGL